nr:F85076probable transposon protein [Ipomoea batatas]
MGQPIGQIAAEMQSYIGVLTRENVKLNYKTWKYVLDDIKEKILEVVNRLNYEENLYKPPTRFGITGEELRQFVITRMSEDFKSTELCDDEEVNRVILWKKGRTKKSSCSAKGAKSEEEIENFKILDDDNELMFIEKQDIFELILMLLLPFPLEFMSNVGDVVGSHVNWSTSFIRVQHEVIT